VVLARETEALLEAHRIEGDHCPVVRQLELLEEGNQVLVGASDRTPPGVE